MFIISGECSSLCSSVPSVPRLCQRCLERSYQGLLPAQYRSINHQERGDAKTFSNYDCKNSKGKWGAVTGEIKEKTGLEIQGNLSNGKSYWNDFCCTRRSLSLAPHLRKRWADSENVPMYVRTTHLLSKIPLLLFKVGRAPVFGQTLERER